MPSSSGRISIRALESPVSEKGKDGATLPLSAVRIDVKDNSAMFDKRNSPSANEGLEIVVPDEPTPPPLDQSPRFHRANSTNGLEIVPADEPSAPPLGVYDESRESKEGKDGKLYQDCAADNENEASSDSSVPETQNNEPTQLPVAHFVDDDMLPQAFVLEDDAIEKKKKKAHESDAPICRWKMCLILLVVVLATVLLAVGLTGGFEPEQPEISFSNTLDDDYEPATSADEPPVVSIDRVGPSPSSTESPSCHLMVPQMINQSEDRAEEPFCDEKICWKRVGPVLTAPKDTHFGDVLSISAMDEDNLRFAVSARKESGCNGEETGVVRFYELTQEARIRQVGQAIEGIMEEGDARGFISGDGHRVVVGMPSSNGLYDVNNVGGWLTFVHNSSSNRWSELGAPFYGHQKQSRLGYTMALSHDGNIVAVGAPMAGDDKTGQVSVYRYDSNARRRWEQIGQTIFAKTRNPEDLFGSDLALSDDGRVLAVGQKSQDKSKTFLEDRGKVAVFHYTNQTWEAMGEEILGEETGDAFGRSVGLSADGTVVVGGVNGRYVYGDTSRNRSAHVRAFSFNQTSKFWEQLGNDIAGNVTLGGNIMNRVAMNAAGDRIALTTYRGSSGGGFSQVFQYDESIGVWKPLGGSIVQNWQTGSGSAIAMSAGGDVIIIGAPVGEHNTFRAYKLSPKEI